MKSYVKCFLSVALIVSVSARAKEGRLAGWRGVADKRFANQQRALEGPFGGGSLQNVEHVIVSQEVLFDYSAAIDGLTADIASNQEELDAVNAQLATLQATVGYESVMAPKITRLTTRKDMLTETIADLQAVLAEVTAVSNLSSEIKDQLYYFYTVLNCKHIEFMIRMPFNYASALSNADVIALLADETNTDEAKTEMAKILYNNYKIAAAHIRSLVKLYRYLQ